MQQCSSEPTRSGNRVGCKLAGGGGEGGRGGREGTSLSRPTPTYCCSYCRCCCRPLLHFQNEKADPPTLHKHARTHPYLLGALCSCCDLSGAALPPLFCLAGGPPMLLLGRAPPAPPHCWSARGWEALRLRSVCCSCSRCSCCCWMNCCRMYCCCLRRSWEGTGGGRPGSDDPWSAGLKVKSVVTPPRRLGRSGGA